MEKQKLLIIEDDESVSTQMKWALSDEYEVFTAADGEKALEALSSVHPPLVTLDLGLPPHPQETGEGFRVLSRILQCDPLTKVIVVTGNSDRAYALSAISLGAHDLFTKPVDVAELKTILKRAFYVYNLEAEHLKLHKERISRSFDEIIGASEHMAGVFSTVRKVAATDVPVLITGESGTGKELIARAIHGESRRRSKHFAPINCGAIPESLLESELFGHEKGAFTGAHVQRAGKVECAQGGTLFLDEIAELPVALQVKLLRFLQDHKIERVGGHGSISIDARVIAATNGDLVKLISEGRFREDLYYRLAVVSIDLPPLRDRGDDIVLIAGSLLQKFSNDSKPRDFSPDAIETLRSYGWPGNVRELENRIRRAITFAEGAVIHAYDLGFSNDEERTSRLDFRKAKEDLEIKFVNMALTKHHGNISKAAEELGLSRPTVHSILKKYSANDPSRKG